MEFKIYENDSVLVCREDGSMDFRIVTDDDNHLASNSGFLMVMCILLSEQDEDFINLLKEKAPQCYKNKKYFK